MGVRPADVVGVRVTVPVKPPDGVTVTVELPEAPVLKSAGEVAEIVKSPPVNVKTAGALWDAVPGEPLPVIVTVNTPELAEVQVRLAPPVPLAMSETLLDGLNGLHDRPAGTVSVSNTVPAKLNVLVRVMEEVEDVPAGTLAGDVALIPKSPTWLTKVAM